MDYDPECEKLISDGGHKQIYNFYDGILCYTFNFFGDIKGRINGYKVKGSQSGTKNRTNPQETEEEVEPDLTCPASAYPEPTPDGY